MSEHWEQLRFGDLFLEPSRNGLMAPKRVRGAGIRLVNMREVFAYDFIGDQDMELAPVPAGATRDWLLQEGDLLFARQSLTLEGAGKSCLVTRVSTPMTFESHLIRVRLNQEVADPSFFYYFFRSPSGRAAIRSITEQVAVAGIRSSDLRNLNLRVPPVEEQRSIANVLAAIDGLAEEDKGICLSVLNLSRTWFNELASRSPGFVRLGDVARVNPEQLRRPGEGTLTYLDIAALTDGGIDWPTPRAWSGAPSRARRLAAVGDVLWSTVRPNRRAHALLPGHPADLVVSTGLAVLRPKEVGPAYLFAATDHPAFADYLTGRADGSAYPAVRADDFLDAKLVDLHPDDREQFERVMWPLWQFVHSLGEEIGQLNRTRDELLGPLMSGRVQPQEVAA
jgi:type I restriction enzyme S subunit